MKIARFLLLVTLVLPGCSNPPEYMRPVDFSGYSKINLDIRDIAIIDRSEGRALPTGATSAGPFNPTISEMVHQWSGARLQSMGTSAQAKLVIKDAYVTKESLGTNSGVFNRDQTGKYSGKLEAELQIDGPSGVAFASASVVRSVTLPNNPSEEEKFHAYVTLLNGLMTDFDRYMDKSIRDYLNRYVITSPNIQNNQPPVARTGWQPD